MKTYMMLIILISPILGNLQNNQSEAGVIKGVVLDAQTKKHTN